MTPVSISFKIEKATPEGRYVSGWLSVVEKDGKVIEDTQGDRISMTELRKGVHKYMAGERIIKKQHSGGKIGEMVEVVMIDDDFAKAHGITHTKRGAWGTAEITDEATRDDVRKGRVQGWSMGGKGKRVPVAKARGDGGRKPRPALGVKAGESARRRQRVIARMLYGSKPSPRVRKSDAGFFDRFL